MALAEKALVARGEDGPRADRVAGDAVRTELLRDLQRERLHGPLRGHVGRAGEQRAEAPRLAAHVDDPAVAVPAHHRDHRTRRRDAGGHVYRHDAFPVLVGLLEEVERHAQRSADVVDQHVDAPLARREFIDRGLDLGALEHVEPAAGDVEAALLRLGQRSLQRRAVAVPDGDARAFGREAIGRALAQAGGGGRDQRDAMLEAAHGRGGVDGRLNSGRPARDSIPGRP